MGHGSAPELLGQTVEAVVVRWESATGRPRRPPDPRAAPVRHRLGALTEHGIDLLLVTASSARRVDAALPPALGPGRRWVWPTRTGVPVESTPDGPVALSGTGGPGPAVAVRALLDHAAGRGIGTGLVLLVLGTGDEDLLVAGTGRCPAVSVARRPTVPERMIRHLGGGVGTVLALLDEQLARRRHRRVPGIDHDPAWTVSPPDGVTRRATDTLLALASGGVATRGAAEEDPGDAPTVLACGVYRDEGPAQELRPLPSWTGLRIEPAPTGDTRVLDLRTGVVLREEGGTATPLRTLRFASAARPGTVALRAEAADGRVRPGPALTVPVDDHASTGGHGALRFARTGTDDERGAAAVAATTHRGRHGAVGTVERLAHYATGRPRLTDVVDAFDEADHAGFDHLLREHRTVWARRWADVDVRIPADPELQRALRFGLFHLWGLASGAAVDPPHRELALGARGATGGGHRGHVSWDADVFVVPALAAVDPGAARAAVRYRLARLPAAREHARRGGHAGACFPRESAAGGEDVTPAAGLPGARSGSTRAGAQEEHTTADVAWAAAHHARWTGDQGFLLGPARPLLVDTARYWASRCRVDDAGRAHIEGVIGPDVQHEDVDDDAFTNIMARWNLRVAADVAERAGVAADEARAWRALADRIVDGLDPVTGRHEQCAGDDALAATRVTGRPDVLTAHHLVPDEAGRGSLLPDLEHHGRRTALGSSLALGVTAALLARAGRTGEALDRLRLVAALDLTDGTGTTAAGLHTATMGAAWQAVLGGFAGVRVEHGVLHVDPRLPPSWTSFEIRFRALGRRVRLRVEGEAVTVTSDQPVVVRLRGGPPVRVAGGGGPVPTPAPGPVDVAVDGAHTTPDGSDAGLSTLRGGR